MLVITPLILSEFVKKKRNKKELLPLCLGIATSANIGSAATIFGNPQNAFIASVTGVSLLDFIIAELPSALFGLSIGLLHVFSKGFVYVVIAMRQYTSTAFTIHMATLLWTSEKGLIVMMHHTS